MSLMNKLRVDNLKARKEKNAVIANLLTTLVSEAAMIGKNNGNRETTDEETLRVVKKFLDNAVETRDLLIKNGANPNRATCDWQPIDGVNLEINILKSYMPEQLTPNALRDLIVTFKSENPGANMGTIMKHLQTYWSGCYDGKLANQIAKEVL